MNWLKRSPTYIESEDGRFVINGPLTLAQAKQACEEAA